MSGPKITVVTVCYNAEREIGRTIQSVIDQTYDNVEYIIVDGASSDGTMTEIKKYHNRISKIVSEPDSGIYNAMNKAAQMATGEWINYMNAGDSFASDNVLADVFGNEIQSDIAVIYGASNFVYSFGSVCIAPESELRFNRRLPFSHQSSFVRSDILKKWGFDEQYKVLADLDFFRRLAINNYHFMLVKTVVSNYAQGGYSQQNALRMFNENEIIQGTMGSIGYYCRLAKELLRLLILKITPNPILNLIRRKRYAK